MIIRPATRRTIGVTHGDSAPPTLRAPGALRAAIRLLAPALARRMLSLTLTHLPGSDELSIGGNGGEI